MLAIVRTRRSVAALAILAALTPAVLAGCTAQAPVAEPSASVTAAACDEAAADVVAAVADLVGVYQQTGTLTGSPSTGPSASPAPTVSPTPSRTVPADPAAAVTRAVEAARLARDRYSCDDDAFTRGLEVGLGAIVAEGPIADAVLRRASASVLGTVRQGSGDWAVGASADLRDVLARAAEGTTVVLPAGVFEFDTTLVLLQGVTLRGAGADATVLRSSATDAGIIAITASPVRFEALALEGAAESPSTLLIAGPAASLALTGVRISGALAAAGSVGLGGAGVYLASTGEAASTRGTTFEMTDSTISDNAWTGIAVGGGHRVSVVSSTFARNGEVGIMFLEGSGGSVADSVFTGNRVAIAAGGTSAPSLLRSTISGGNVGVQVDADAAPLVDGLSIDGTSSAAVAFGGSSSGSITGTTCVDVAYGIVIADGAAPVLGDNACSYVRGE